MRDFSVDYFKDEVRCGFYIPTAVKQAWAAGLTILSEIDRICEKYDITYYADWGTLLGAIRHGGYVPWDDDLDICMRREDYVRFREVADKELPSEFAIHDYERKEDHWLFLSRVVNRNQICFEESHLEKYHNFPYIATVDIFIQDYLYEDEQKEKERCDEVKYIIAVADSIVKLGKVDSIKDWQLKQIEEKYHMNFNRRENVRTLGIQLYQLAEQQMARVSADESKTLGQIFPWILKGRKGLPKTYYEETIRVPFENTTIPVPARYHQVLSARYGNYLEVHKVWCGHDYPYFEGQRRNLQAVADFTLPEFSYTEDMEKINESIYSKSLVTTTCDDWKSLVKECESNIGDYHERINQLIKKRELQEVLSLLPECQQLIVDLGSFVESIKGEEKDYVVEFVGVLSDYCNSLYEIYEGISKDFPITTLEISGKKLELLYKQIKENLDKICNRQEVVFLPTGGNNWNAFAPMYAEMISDENTDVSVIPLPVFFKNIYGKIVTKITDWNEQIERNTYPADLPVLSYSEYNIQLHHPDIVVIQDPYDGENPCLTIPSQYYAGFIRNYTSQLIYIPSFVSDDFNEKDYCDQNNLKYYVTAPAIIYADQVIIPSRQLKMQYINRLVEFAGENTRKYWEKKIICKENKTEDNNVIKSRKCILYCIGENQLLEGNDDLISIIESKFKLFEQAKEKLDVKICFFPGDMENWKKLNPDRANDILRLVEKYTAYEWCKCCNPDMSGVRELLSECDGYYGDSSPLIPEFVRSKKPVMLAQYI